MKSRAVSVVAVGFCLLGAVGCRDWDRFDPLSSGGGPSGGGPSGGGGDGAGLQGGNAAGGAGGGVGGGGGSLGGGGAGGGGGGPSECGTIDIVSDEFENAAFDWRWENYAPHFSLGGGDLILTMPGGLDEYFQIQTTAAFDMRGRSVVFELSEPPTQGHGYWFNVAGDHDNYVEFYINFSGTLGYAVEEDDSYNTFASEPFDAIDHRFFRFRESGGTMFYETSPDGASWTARTDTDISTVFDPEFTHVYLGGNTDAQSPGCTVRVARVYAEPASAGHTCATASLSDDFEDGSQANVWGDGWSSPGCTLDEGSGELRVSCSAASYTDSAYGTSTAYDLTGSSASVEITDPPAPGEDSFMAFALGRPEAETLYSIETNGTSLEVYEVVDGNWDQIVSLPFDVATMRVLRFAEAGGQILFEHSADGVSFTTFHQKVPLFSLSELGIYLVAGNNSDTVASVMAFDNLNLSP